MPKISIIEREKLIQAILDKKNCIFDQATKKILGPSNFCWKEIALDLKNVITPKYIYTVVHENRYNILDQIKDKNANISIDENENKLQPDYFTVTSTESNSDDIESNEIKFTITLSSDEWKQIYKEDSQIYKRNDGKNSVRAYNTLTPYEWTTVIHSHFYGQTKIICPIAYKNAKILLTGNIFLTISGHCSICKSVFIGKVENLPEPETQVFMRCSYSGLFKSCSSGKKRRIIGHRRDMFLNKISNQNMSSSYIQKLEANRLMDYGDLEPPHLPTMNALRVMKYKDRQKKMLHEDSIMALSLLQGTVPYDNIIHDIGYNRFFVHYWTTTEINTYRVYANQNRIPRITIDATGGLVKKLKLITGRETASIFLYEIGVMDYINKCQFTAAHMLSERHDSNSISYWLTEWLKSKIVAPKIVVTDQSLALMMAVVKSFTQYSLLTKYISVCSSIILKESTELPTCMLRNDFNHIVHLISAWPEMKTTSYRIKNFYMRSICLLITSDNFEEIKLLLKYIFTVSLNEEDGLNSEQLPTPCENAKNCLKQKIANNQILFDYEDEMKTSESLQKTLEYTNDTGMEDVGSTNVFNEIKKIYDQCLYDSRTSSSKGSHDNMQYNPKIAKKLLDFCKLLPTWSAVMVPFFGYGSITESSSTSESLFNELKNRVFQHKTLPIRLDEFVQEHINFITGSMKLVKGKPEYNKYDPNQNKVQERENTDHIIKFHSDEDVDNFFPPKEDDLTAVENWRGLTKKAKKMKKNYRSSDKTVLYYNEGSKTKSPLIGILRNGNSLDLKSIIIGETHCTFTNTCTFDTIFHILCTSYVDSVNYAKFIDDNLSETLYSMVSNAIRDGINVQSYKKRAIILSDIFSQNKQDTNVRYLPGDLTHYDCACSAIFLFNHLFKHFPSFKQHTMCTNCNSKNTYEEKTIIANLPTKTTDFLQDVLNNRFTNKIQICDLCGFFAKSSSFILGNHIFIETCIPTSNHQRNVQNFDLSVVLSCIPQKVQILEHNYTLRGVVNFIAPTTKHKDSVGHYISYCWREENNRWEKYDDLQRASRTVRNTTTATGCQYLIYTI